MKKILIFVASGFSTRMGGFPKGLSLVNDEPVMVSAIDKAKVLYDDVYVICNNKTHAQFAETFDKFKCTAKLRPIVTGKGDAESVLKSIELVKNELGEDFDCTFCWGDAFFTSSIPYECMLNSNISIAKSIIVGCSVDNDPYAYFDIYTHDGRFSNAFISKSYFKKRDGSVPVGIHDQCIFRCFSHTYLEVMTLYRWKLGYNGTDYIESPTNEMGLLNSFNFFNEVGKPASIALIPCNNVFSFNTIDELKTISDNLRLQEDNLRI